MAKKSIFTDDIVSSKPDIVHKRVPLTNCEIVLEADTKLNADPRAIALAEEINNNIIGDFENKETDKMSHVSTFCYCNGNIYVTYYANTFSAVEHPEHQSARLAYAPENDMSKMKILNIMSAGDILDGKKVTGVYDTIFMKKDDDDTYLYLLWTASIEGRYYRLYRTFNMETEELGDIVVNRFKVGDVTNDFCDSGFKNALKANGIGYKETFVDIGIMQKTSTRIEDGKKYYYSGAYSGNFTCIIKSTDFITWEYVAQPDEGANGTGFESETKWENAVYVLNDKVYYFVRQWEHNGLEGEASEGGFYGILTSYDLITKEWTKPILVGDCQSRSDFIVYNGELYLFHAPTDREHLGIIRVDTDDITKSEIVLQADMKGSFFYPFVEYNSSGELSISYTINRQHIRMSKFTLSKYI